MSRTGTRVLRRLELVRVNVAVASLPCTLIYPVMVPHGHAALPGRPRATHSLVTVPSVFIVAANILLGRWNMPSVGDTDGMLSYVCTLDSNISKWDVSSATDVAAMVMAATSFNGYLSSWGVPGAHDSSDMFSSADLFNGDISQ